MSAREVNCCAHCCYCCSVRSVEFILHLGLVVHVVSLTLLGRCFIRCLLRGPETSEPSTSLVLTTAVNVDNFF